MKKRYLVLLLLPLVLVLSYALGPQAKFPAWQPQLPTVESDLQVLERTILTREAQVPHLKANNESRFYWADSVPQKTEYAIVYLHGFSASPMEGDPTHRLFAERYGYNLYVPRIAGHGIADPESFGDLTPGQLIASAEEALQVGQQIGDKVMLMACSTGGTYSIYLAAQYPELVHSLILYAPNIALADGTAALLTYPWGREIAYSLLGEYMINTHLTPEHPGFPYSTTTYRTDGLLCLQSLLDQTMTEENFQKISQPYLIACYYQDEEHQDPTVSVAAMRDFMTQTATPAAQKRLAELPHVNTHVVPSGIYSEDLASVNRVSYSFAEEVLGWKPR